jgi:type I restriction enzyme M protein
MNCFLHGIEDFRIERGDTLAEPKLVEGDRLQRFDVVLANPPYSIKQWNREAFAADPWGRNVFGVPPQGRADYAFQQHILQSLKPKTGRCAVLWPHGVLFRQEEDEIRRKLIEADLIECVVGLGPNLFYNSAMDSCVVICRTQKPKDRRGKILLIDAKGEVTRERTQSFLTNEHIERIVQSYELFESKPGFTCIATLEEIRSRDYNLNIALYISNTISITSQRADSLQSANDTFRNFLESTAHWRSSIEKVLNQQKIPSIASGCAGLSLPTWIKKSEWRRKRLGEVVRQVRDRVDDPDSAGISHYLPGGGISAINLRIKDWKPVDDGLMGPAFHMRLMPGHVLYKSRVPHGVGVADRIGICANTTYVLEAIPDLLDQRLLPFLLITESFRRFEKDNNRGSTNLFLNYSDIAKFELNLPPLDQQRRISEILVAAEISLEASRSALSAVNDLRVAKLFDRYRSGIGHTKFTDTALGKRPRSWEVAPLGSHYQVQLGKMLSPKATSGGFHRPYLRNANVQWNRLDLEDVATMSFDPREAKKFELRDGDILACEGRHVGKSAIWRNEIPGACFQKALHRIRALDDEQVPEFMLFQMEHHSRSGIFAEQVAETTIPHLPAERLRAIPFSFPPKDEQRAIAEEIGTLGTLAEKLQHQVDAGSNLLGSLINIFTS